MRDDRIDTTDYAADVHFDCPRCGAQVSERLYGPCSDCRVQMQHSVGIGGEGTVVAAEYEPKMNVTPNAVALKDD